MKVLFIAPLPPPVTGQSVAVQALFDQLQDDGHSVVSVNLRKNTFRQGISSLTRIFEVVRFVWFVWRSGQSFDLVYLNSSQSISGNLKDMLLLLVLGRLRAKTWLHLHGGAGMRKLLANRSGLLGRLNAYFLKRVAGVIVLGERQAPIFDGYVDPPRIRIVKNFASDNLFISPEQIAAKWVDTATVRVLFLSNLLPGKGHVELLQAIHSLPSQVADRLQFDFAGGFESKEDESQFRAAIADMPQVSYHGVVHGLAKQELLAEAHVFCLPTYYPYEGQPISILEAYASGCVVLTTDHSGIFDIFTPSENGWEVEPRNPASIVMALQAVVGAPDESAGLAIHNVQQARQLFTRRSHLAALYGAMNVGELQ